MEQFLTVDEVAAQLNVPKKWILAQIKSGSIASYRLGPQTIRLTQSNIDEFVADGFIPAQRVVSE